MPCTRMPIVRRGTRNDDLMTRLILYTTLGLLVGSGMVRGERLASGWAQDTRLKVVIHALPPGLNNPDDAAVRRISVAAFQRLCDQPIAWDPASTGYTMRGMDGQAYVVVQNMGSRPRVCTVNLRRPARAAADLLSGQALPVNRSAGGDIQVKCLLPAEGATVIVLYDF